MGALFLLGPAGQSPATEAAYAASVTPLATRLGLATTACYLVFRETEAWPRSTLARSYWCVMWRARGGL